MAVDITWCDRVDGQESHSTVTHCLDGPNNPLKRPPLQNPVDMNLGIKIPTHEIWETHSTVIKHEEMKREVY